MIVHFRPGRRVWRWALAGVVVVTLVGAGGAVSAAPATRSPKKLVTITLTAPPNGVAVDAVTDTVYAESASGYVFAIDGKTNKVVATMTALSPAPEGIVVDPRTDLVYTFNYGGPHAVVTVINGKTNKVIKTFNAGSWGQAGLAIDPATDRLYIAKNDSSPSVTVVNAKSDKVIANIPVGPHPADVAVDPTTDIVYVDHVPFGDNPAPADTIINAKTDKVISTIVTGTEPITLAVDSVTHQAYFADNADSSIVYVLTTTDHGKHTKLTGRIHLGLGNDPLGLSVDTSNHTIVVSDNNFDRASIVNGKTNKVIRSLAVGQFPDGVAVDAKTNVAYISAFGSNQVDVIPSA